MAEAHWRYTGSPGWKPSLAITPGLIFRLMSTRETSPRVAAQSAKARSWRRASAPDTQRKGCGGPGNWCTGGSGANTTCATPNALRSQLAKASRVATARCEATWSMTSFTPVTTTAMSKCGRPWRCCCWSRRRVWAVVRPDCATSRQLTRAAQPCATSGTNWPASASLCVTTPTPAADESPATSKRNSGPVPTTPRLAPGGSGSLGSRRRVRSACTSNNGMSASLAASDIAG